MADQSTLTELPTQATAASRPLLSTLSRWWGPTATPSADPVLGYESAQPWMLDDTPEVN